MKRYYSNSLMETTPLPLFLGLKSKVEKETAQRQSSHINSTKSTKKEDQKDITGFFPNKLKRHKETGSHFLKYSDVLRADDQHTTQLLCASAPASKYPLECLFQLLWCDGGSRGTVLPTCMLARASSLSSDNTGVTRV